MISNVVAVSVARLPKLCSLARPMPSELAISHHSRQKIVQCLGGALSRLALRRAGAKKAHLSGLEAEQARAKRLAEITAHLDTLNDDGLDLRLRQYQRATGRLRMGKANHRSRGR